MPLSAAPRQRFGAFATSGDERSVRARVGSTWSNVARGIDSIAGANGDDQAVDAEFGGKLGDMEPQGSQP